jgi:hypothetical protein
MHLKPTTTRRGLLFMAGIVWAVAGGILGYRGIRFIEQAALHPAALLLVAAVGGALFFVFMFQKISGRHIVRILHITHDRPCLFSFVGWKSYLMMGLMITMGVLLRKASFIPREELGTAYVTMAVPLLASSFRFFRTGATM